MYRKFELKILSSMEESFTIIENYTFQSDKRWSNLHLWMNLMDSNQFVLREYLMLLLFMAK